MKTVIIDDQEMSIFLTSFILTEAKFTEDITSYSVAEEALAVLLREEAANLPRIIFLDLNMPHMSGWEFLEALNPHKQRFHGRCQIYILTSSLDKADMDKSKDYELVYGFIHKPINSEDIELILAQAEESNK